jgi:hypothetical protein
MSNHNLEQLAASISTKKLKQLDQLLPKHLSKVKCWPTARLPIFEAIVEGTGRVCWTEKRRRLCIFYESFRLACEEMGFSGTRRCPP